MTNVLHPLYVRQQNSQPTQLVMNSTAPLRPSQVNISQATTPLFLNQSNQNVDPFINSPYQPTTLSSQAYMSKATQPLKNLTFSSTPTAPSFVNSIPSQIIHPNQRYLPLVTNNGTMHQLNPTLTQPDRQFELWEDYCAAVKPVQVALSCEESAKICLVRWQIPFLPSHLSRKNYIKIYKNEQLHNSKKLENNVSKYSVETISGECYMCEYIITDFQNTIMAFGSIRFRATFSKEEINQLYQKAIIGFPCYMNSFSLLYRCKPPSYWNNIRVREGNIMSKYIKDNSGQAANPINGIINGLFFNANVTDNGNLPPKSLYGNERMTIRAEVLLDPERVNMYFCDFYCNYEAHYVTIVVCDKGSESDSYCGDKLLPLPYNNPFLLILNTGKSYEFHVHNKVWIEIFYTENVPLRGSNFYLVNSSGTSTPGAMSSNKKYQPSKPESIGKDMAGSWGGNRDKEGQVSTNYVGRPGNAIPNYNPYTPNGVPPSTWTHDRMKQYRDEAKEKREAAGK